jgi:ectoine hydroxylase-related dioxygenase (phytanoyl-CoA dioxygenase family)
VTRTHDATRREYEEDGHVIFRSLIDPDLIATANQHVDRLLEHNPDPRPNQLRHELARNDPFWYHLVSEPRLLDIAEIFVGPDIALFATHYICKEPRAGRPVLWHQDGAFWRIEPVEVVTLWLALTHSTPENGYLKVVPGSHNTKLLDVVEVTKDAVLPEQIPVEVDGQNAVSLEPGDVSLYHPNLVHGSAPTAPTYRGAALPSATSPPQPKSSIPTQPAPSSARTHCGYFDHHIRSSVPALSRAPTEVGEGSDYRCARGMTREGRLP